MHFVRHKIGVEHFVTTQRDDRTGKERDYISQETLVNHNCFANAASIIQISRKRLCRMAHPETRNAWLLFLKELRNFEPELVDVCVPECVYRYGNCPEFKSCGWNNSDDYLQKLSTYMDLKK